MVQPEPDILTKEYNQGVPIKPIVKALPEDVRNLVQGGRPRIGALWSLGDDGIDARGHAHPVLGRAAFCDQVLEIGQATSGKRVVIVQDAHSQAGLSGTGKSFSIRILRALMRPRPGVVVPFSAPALANVEPDAFLTDLAGQLSLLTPEIPMPPRPIEERQLTRWFANDLPNWFGLLVEEGAREGARLRPREIPATEVDDDIVFAPTWIAIDDMQKASLGPALRECIAGLIGVTDATGRVAPGIGGLRWLLIGAVPDFVREMSIEYELETLDQTKIGLAEWLTCCRVALEANGLGSEYHEPAAVTFYDLLKANQPVLEDVVEQARPDPTYLPTFATVLTDAAQSGTLAEALQEEAERDDLEGQMLREVLRERAPDPGQLTLGELERLSQVAGWLEGTPLQNKAPDDQDMRRLQRRREILDPFLLLVGQLEGASSVPDRFVGREAELERLRAHVGVLPPESWPHAVQRGLRGIWSAVGAGPERNEPLRIEGSGGTGKSTLIAKFVLEHSRYMLANPDQRYLRLPFVYIDFDRATLTAREPLQLLLEVAGQLATWLPEIQQDMEKVRDDLRDALDKQVSPDAKKRERETWSELRGHCRTIRKLVEGATGGESPVVIIFDTYELVQYNSEAVTGVNGLIDSLRGGPDDQWGNLRVIVSGRGVLSEIRSRLKPLRVPPLSRAAVRHLVELRNDHEDLKLSAAQIESLAQALSGNPLDVIIVTGWLRDHKEQTSAFLAEVASDRELRAASVGEPSPAMEARITALLVRRMVDHIATRAVREIAVPGFVVRAIDADVIREVMMPGAINRSADAGASVRAQILFRRLKAERWLVYPHGGMVRHRAEVRSGMLTLIRERDRSAFYETNERAIDFFRRRAERTVDRAELVYHLLLADPPRIGEADELWGQDLAPYIATGLDDLARPAQNYLRIRLGHSYSAQSLVALPGRTLRSVFSTSASAILARIGPDAALEVLYRNAEFASSPEGEALRLEANYRSGRWRELARDEDHGLIRTAARDLQDLRLASRVRPVEAMRLSALLRLGMRDPAFDALWRPAIPILQDAGFRFERRSDWAALAFAACWRRRNLPGMSAIETVPPILRDRRARTVLADSGVRSGTALRVLSMLEDPDSFAFLRHIDLRTYFGTVSGRELNSFRTMVELAISADASPSNGSEDEMFAEAEALVRMTRDSDGEIIADPVLSARIGVAAQRLFTFRPQALARSVRQLLFSSHPDWLSPLGAALDRAYNGEVPSQRGFFWNTRDFLGREGGRQRPARARSNGAIIVALADEEGNLRQLVAAYRQHLKSAQGRSEQATNFLYLAHCFDAWCAILDPDAVRPALAQAPVGREAEPGDFASLAPPSDDPQKFQWGRLPERNGWRVTAKVRQTKRDADWFKIDLSVVPTSDKRLHDSIRFHLHDTFPNSIRDVEPSSQREANLRVWAYGAFTVGVLVTQDGTRLEIDLAELEDAPSEFRRR